MKAFSRLRKWIQDKTERRAFRWEDLTVQQYQHICMIQAVFGAHTPKDGHSAMLAVRILSVLLNKTFDQLIKKYPPRKVGELAAKHTAFLGTQPPVRLVSGFRLGRELFSIPPTYDTVPLYQWQQIESHILKGSNPDSANDLATFLAVACVQPLTSFDTQRIPELAAKFRNVKFLTAIGMRAFFLTVWNKSTKTTNPSSLTTALRALFRHTPNVTAGLPS